MTTYLAERSLKRIANDRFSLNLTKNLFLAGLQDVFVNIMKYNAQYFSEAHIETSDQKSDQSKIFSDEMTSSVLSTLTLKEMNFIFVD